MRGQPAVYTRVGRRFPHRQGQSFGRKAQHARSAHSLLRIHRPSACARGTKRERGEAQGLALPVPKIPPSAVLLAQAICELQGFLKLLVGNDDRILGFTMIGPEAGEVMAVVQTAILAGMPYTRLSEAIFAHPTMAEGLGFLIASVPNASVPI